MQSHISQALSVSAVAKFIYSIISQNISNIWVRGEISNFKIQQNGNAYFTIKDTDSKINVIIMSNSNARKVIVDLKNGMEILIYGKLSYYKKEGYLTFFVEEIEFIGEGLLKQKFDELKNKLEAEGLFSIEHKRRIPEYPQWVGVVTSPTGAAIQDILNITNRRFGNINLIVFPSAVQGENASKEIADAIWVANKFASHYIDVLIVGRGGGSLEDLWCFNEETVARAIYSSKIPVISAIGHEIDYTIADYVADMRAPTPSAAAELVVKDKKQIINYIENLSTRIDTIINNNIENLKKNIEYLRKENLKRLVVSIYAEYSMTYNNLKIRFLNLFENYVKKINTLIILQKEKLKTLNPNNILKRGYSITYKILSDGSKINILTLHAVTKGDVIKTVIMDGNFQSVVK